MNVIRLQAALWNTQSGYWFQRYSFCSQIFILNDTAPTEIYTLSLHDALPISTDSSAQERVREKLRRGARNRNWRNGIDRKSTRLNSSHITISYAVFCLKKKKPFRLRRSHLSPTLVHSYHCARKSTAPTYLHL